MATNFERDIALVQTIAAVPLILDVVCRTTGMGFAAVARVTEDRWIACQVLDNVNFGLAPGGELQIETTLCHEVRQTREAIVIDNVAEDPVYCTHHTPQIYGLQSYISVPIFLKDGSFFGTLCAIDPKPAKLDNPQVRGMFQLFSELIAHHIDAALELETAVARSQEEERLAAAREQYIAVLGHDLRNPLAALSAGTSRLLRDAPTDRQRVVLDLMTSTLARMGTLIENVLELARARQGMPPALQMDGTQPLGPTLTAIVEELRVAHPDHRIEADIDASTPVRANHVRIGQLLSNLLGNAIRHGDTRQPITIVARVDGTAFRLSVANSGRPIPAEKIGRIFDPFVRGDGDKSTGGLGLGLFIASRIAAAHGGGIDVVSNETATTFTFVMPVGSPDGAPAPALTRSA